MILVDTNILIDFLKNPTKEKEVIFQENEIATCGVIFTELLRGSKNPKESEKLKTVLECFEYLSFEKLDWLEISSLFAVFSPPNPSTYSIHTGSLYPFCSQIHLS